MIIRWYLVPLEAHPDPLMPPRPTAAARKYGRCSVIRLTASLGLARIVCSEADHATIEQAIKDRFVLGTTFGQLPNQFKNRVRNFASANGVTINDTDTIEDVIEKLGQIKIPGWRRSQWRRTYVQDGVTRDESMMTES